MNKLFKILLGPLLAAVPARSCVAICLFTQCLATLATAGELDGAMGISSNVIAFFRQAVRSAPEIERFVACQRLLRQRGPPSRPMDIPDSELPPPEFYEGGCSGRNFFLRHETTNSIDGHVSERTSGRAGSNSYQINENALVRTSETLESNRKNPIAAFAESSYDTIRQIFNMGIGEMRPESLVWEGNAFSALRGAGVPFYGRLVISNGLPFELKLSKERGGSPYKMCSYFYPDPPDSLGGFPARTVIWTLFGDGLHPFLELTLLNVQIAKAPIPEESFSETGFATTNTISTIIYSNNSRFILSTNGQMIKMVPPVKRSIMSMLRHVTLVLIGMGVLSAFLLLLLWRNWDEQN